MVKVDIFDDLRAYAPVDSVEFDSIQAARDYMTSEEMKRTPCEVVDGMRTVCRNYPNMFKGTIDMRDKKKALWLAGDDSWKRYDF